MVTATVGMVILFPVAAELGKRAQKALGAAGEPPAAVPPPAAGAQRPA
jgi:hypothetical protein